MSKDERFQSLYRGYYRRVVNYFVRAFRVSPEDAEELTQDTFTRFYEAMDEYRGDARWAYFETIAFRLGCNRVRSLNTARRRGRHEDVDDPKLSEVTSTSPPDYAQREQDVLRQRRLYEEIDRLPPGQRQCLQLWLEDFSYDEIAAALRITVDAVRSRLRDARKLLRARLGDENALPEDES